MKNLFEPSERGLFCSGRHPRLRFSLKKGLGFGRASVDHVEAARGQMYGETQRSKSWVTGHSTSKQLNYLNVLGPYL